MFDGILNEEIISLDSPSLKGLSHVLRHKELWPEGFVWDYANSETCAIGLSREMWASCCCFSTVYKWTADIIGSKSQAWDIFINANSVTGIPFGEIKPEHVADIIDAVASGSYDRETFRKTYAPSR